MFSFSAIGAYPWLLVRAVPHLGCGASATTDNPRLKLFHMRHRVGAIAGRQKPPVAHNAHAETEYAGTRLEGRECYVAS